MVARNLESARPRKGTQRFLSSLAVCAIAVVANFAGSQIARAFGLPLYLDCVGTIVASLLGGYLPGIIVGYATNLIVGLVADSMMLYFAIVNVLVAVVTAFVSNREIPKSAVGKGACTALALALLCGLFSTFIQWGLNGLPAGGLSLQAFADGLQLDMVDKSLSVALGMAVARIRGVSDVGYRMR